MQNLVHTINRKDNNAKCRYLNNIFNPVVNNKFLLHL